jgi:hypothetical protein
MLNAAYTGFIHVTLLYYNISKMYFEINKIMYVII